MARDDGDEARAVAARQADVAARDSGGPGRAARRQLRRGRRPPRSAARRGGRAPSSSGWTPPSTRPTASVTTCARCSRPVPPRRPTVSPDPTTIDVYWRLPIHGDPASAARRHARARRLDAHHGGQSGARSTRRPRRRASATSTTSGDIARAAEVVGVRGRRSSRRSRRRTTRGSSAPALAGRTTTFRFMVAFQPGFLNPVHIAHLSSSLQRLTGGRLVYNVITGGGGPDQALVGRPRRPRRALLPHAGVPGRPARRVGHHARRPRRAALLGAGREPDRPARRATVPRDLPLRLVRRRASRPPGQHADHYLSWLEPFDALAGQVRSACGARPAAIGRQPTFAVRVDVLARPTHDEAWAEARRGFAAADPSAQRPWARVTRRRLGGGGPPGGRSAPKRRPGPTTCWWRRTSGRASTCCVRAPPSASSATTPPSPSGSTTSSPSGSTPSSSPACRTSKRRSASAKRCSRC